MTKISLWETFRKVTVYPGTRCILKAFKTNGTGSFGSRESDGKVYSIDSIFPT